MLQAQGGAGSAPGTGGPSSSRAGSSSAGASTPARVPGPSAALGPRTPAPTAQYLTVEPLATHPTAVAFAAFREAAAAAAAAESSAPAAAERRRQAEAEAAALVHGQGYEQVLRRLSPEAAGSPPTATDRLLSVWRQTAGRKPNSDGGCT